jgi:hypothetical protein
MRTMREQSGIRRACADHPSNPPQRSQPTTPIHPTIPPTTPIHPTTVNRAFARTVRPIERPADKRAQEGAGRGGAQRTRTDGWTDRKTGADRHRHRDSGRHRRTDGNADGRTQTDGRTHRQAGTGRHRQTYAYAHTDKTHKDTDRHRQTQTDKDTGGQTQTNRHTDAQTHRHTDKQTRIRR